MKQFHFLPTASRFGLKSGVFFFILLLALHSCTDRKRDNPFDLAGERQSPIRLSLSYSGPLVRISWNAEKLDNFLGFRIYRSIGNDQNFQLFAEVGRDKSSVVDSTITDGRWYFYKATIVGPAGESLPSNIEKTYPGPGNTWVVSSSGFWVRELRYDLQHILKDIPTDFPAESWDIFLPDSLAWLNIRNFGRVDEVNLHLQQETHLIEDPLVRPVDVSFDKLTGRLFVLDDSLNTVFIFRDYNLIDTLQLTPDAYLKMKMLPDSHNLIILGKAGYYRFASVENSQKQRFKFAQLFEGRDFSVSRGDLFVLAASQEGDLSRIFRVPIAGFEADSLELSGNFYKITADLDRNVLYVAQAIPSADDPVVKLSPDGQRLEDLSKYAKVAQIVVNPVDHSVVVVDRFNDRLVLFDADGNFIAQSVMLFDPVRARTE